jgi:hypothetical protein
MSIQSTIERVNAIRQAIADPSEMIASSPSGVTGGTEAAPIATSASVSPFAAALEAASGEASTQDGLAVPASSYGGYGLSGVSGVSALSGSSTPGSRIVAAAESQIGQSEQPPGSNESPAIAEYRASTAGSVPGAPWCAYFASWAARQAGEPIGADGQGLGSVGEVWSWAQSTGRAIANGPGVVPQPGDLIVFGDEHVGIVKDVLPNGQIQTIEGNFENKVAANVRSPTEATGYVSMS